MFGREVEESHDAGPRVAVDVGGGRGEGDAEGRGDRVVAVVEVLVEGLAADPGTADDLADGQAVDLPFVREVEGRLAQAGADPLRSGVDAMRPCSHTSSVSHFVDS